MNNNSGNNPNNGQNPSKPTDYSQRGGAKTPTYRKPTPPPSPKTNNK